MVISISKFKLYREDAGIISKNKIWVFLDGTGYLYYNESLFKLLWEVFREWRSNKHLVG